MLNDFTDTYTSIPETTRNPSAFSQIITEPNNEKVHDERVKELFDLINGLVESLPFSRRSSYMRKKRAIGYGVRNLWINGYNLYPWSNVGSHKKVTKKLLGSTPVSFKEAEENSVKKPKNAVSLKLIFM